MNLVLFFILVALFVALTPGVLVYLPPKSSKMTTALTHGFIFALVWTIISKPLMNMTRHMNFMEGATTMKMDSKKPDPKESKPSN